VTRYLTGYGEHVTAFAKTFIRQTKGRWAGQPLELEVWQRDLLDELYLVDEHGNFVYREALVGVPRKNGKSTLCSAIALYGLLASGEAGAEVYAAAGSKDQARIVFDQARAFVEASPRLREWLQPMRNVIVCKQNGGIFRVLSSDAPLQHGLNPSLVVIDELHAHEDPELYWALTTGQLARENPLVVSITTAGYDRESILWDVYSRGRALRDEGVHAMRRERFFFRWFEGPHNCSLQDPVALKAANPSSWLTAADLQREARRMPESVFRRLHLNQWTATEDAWLSEDSWDACKGNPVIDPALPVYAGVDVGLMRDSSALVGCQWRDGKLHVKQRIWLPEDNPNLGAQDIRIAVGRFAGATPGLKEVAYDPWAFRESAEELFDRGVPMVQFDQNSSRMSPASQKLYELVDEGRLVHDGDPVFKQQILAAVAADTERGWRISKRKSKQRIDATVALAIASDRAAESLVKPRLAKVQFW
jgi:phage terminase large subunit-like protein